MRWVEAEAARGPRARGFMEEIPEMTTLEIPQVRAVRVALVEVVPRLSPTRHPDPQSGAGARGAQGVLGLMVAKGALLFLGALAAAVVAE
jgi:hypothetical protein